MIILSSGIPFCSIFPTLENPTFTVQKEQNDFDQFILQK